MSRADGGRLTVVFDGGILGAGPITGVGGSFLTTLRAYAEVSPHRSIVLAPEHAERPDVPGVEFVDCPSGPIARQVQLPRSLRRLRTDVLHSPVAAFPMRWRRAIATVHDLPWMARERLDEVGCGARHRLAARIAASRAAAIIVPTQATADDLLRYTKVNPARVNVIHHGVTAPDRPAVAAELCGPFLVLGDDRPRKNHARLRAAHALARQQAPDLPPLRFIGPGFEYVTESDKLRILRSARALVHLALHEGFGLPVLEALAHGVPVLASGIPSLREVAGGAALLVDPRDETAMADGMIRVHRDRPLRDDLRELGLARAATLRPETTASAWLRLHEQLGPHHRSTRCTSP